MWRVKAAQSDACVGLCLRGAPASLRASRNLRVQRMKPETVRTAAVVANNFLNQKIGGELQKISKSTSSPDAPRTRAPVTRAPPSPGARSVLGVSSLCCASRGWLARRDASWSHRAKHSLPTPLSPVMSTVESR